MISFKKPLGLVSCLAVVGAVVGGSFTASAATDPSHTYLQRVDALNKRYMQNASQIKHSGASPQERTAALKTLGSTYDAQKRQLGHDWSAQKAAANQAHEARLTRENGHGNFSSRRVYRPNLLWRLLGL